MITIAKDRLEEICMLYMNHQPRQRAVSFVLLDRLEAANTNWSLGAVAPRLDLHDAKASFAAVRELQSVFRLTA